MLKFKPKAQPQERRRNERLAMRGLAKIQIGTGSLPRDCWVSDISDGGVRLHAESVEVPGADWERQYSSPPTDNSAIRPPSISPARSAGGRLRRAICGESGVPSRLRGNGSAILIAIQSSL